MQTDRIEYGLRSVSTGRLVRLEEHHYQSDETGSETDSYLTFNDEFPYLKVGQISSMMLSRFGQEFLGRPSSEFFFGSGVDLHDLEIVEYLTTSRSTPAGGGDPAAFGVEVSRLEFDIVSDVNYQYVQRPGAAKKALLQAFTHAEVLAMPAVPQIELVILRSKSVDVATAGLAGSIILPRRREIGLPGAPMGVVGVRTVDGVTYAAVSPSLSNPYFRRTVSLVDGLDPHDQPWGDVRVSFGFDASDDAEELLGGIWDDQLEGTSVWPKGWSIDETDASGARTVVVFKVQGPVREADGRAVRRILDGISIGVDPRRPDAPSVGSFRRR